MKIREGWAAGAGLCVTFALLSVCARPLRERDTETNVVRWESSDSEAMAAGYLPFRRKAATKSPEIADDSLENLQGDVEEDVEMVPSTMRAITAKAKSDVVLLPLIIEPEAEMLPPGYKGVKPPGVSHMELVFMKPQTGRSDRRRSAASSTPDGNPTDSPYGFDRNPDAYYAASERETQLTRGGGKLAGSELAAAGVSKKHSASSSYVESSAEGRSRSEDERRAAKHAGRAAEKKDVSHESGGSGGRARNSGGYRSVYQRDEAKKDADFYDNARQGGLFEKHGRYGEKHGAVEGSYGNGSRHESSRVKTKTNKRRKLEVPKAS
ncbi:uncharacterized protein LOC105180593 [Harpegnathos saltator]|uniref:uncharacterized protein LOC105180593 n=1 Tax=Harpegnathos saltator TaxID=610380 RepID=UPI000DBEF25A|nr:uncharacterized protein LOC105180593 [Harpegnathos saltator]